ncbi:kinase-like protein [Ceraceosorus guamensis]|uniref:non-specific serine/threonine protein kinase n=1 Tax=Ceraceosorus guamensis TaxID=1522189 RepID=A0A316W0P8_9BASI|nr:kinase-like protein [Ceraceosorus guamensis]PWN42303.1 kinase-like protein [Ceraceosorus guamensis]
MSAADYNPDSDRLEDEARARAKLQTNTGANGASQPVEGGPSLAAGIGEAQERVDGAESEYEEIEVDDDDEVDDMFALGSDDESSKPKKKIIRVKKGAIASQAVSANLLDNFDDADGYYRINLGERIGPEGRYLVFANLGRGMFSNVVKARETIPSTSTEPAREREVAIKVVRSQETMYKAGIKEMAILQKLASLDPEDKRHVIRLDSHFEHRGHLCMVFELLSMNLREVVKRFGKDVGLNYRAVRAYAHQMFLALSLLRKANVIHADIKPDNILVNEGKNVLKLCDLGSASDATEVEITPYLVSRFYRAPEIVLGAPYDSAIDVWSIGCTLYEVATGKILFPGRTNNQMLLLMQELRGRFTTKQAKKGRFAAQHFDDTNNFLSMEKDKNTGVDVIRKVNLQKPVEDLRARLLPANTAKKLSDEELRLTNNFIDLLNRTLELDPAKRITPREALNHPFLS